ncbi:MAG: aryl-sulfate sulfotransferase [Bdellovibrionales bacterium]|nr:aryl-sulfate sulfotransferase [Bdellovibrionales bacterium]
MWQLGRPNTLWIGIFFLGIFFAFVAALSSALVKLSRESYLKEISENGVVSWSPESILSENGYILYLSPGMECHLLTMDGIDQGLVPGRLCKILEDGSVVSTVADSENNNDIVKFNGSSVHWRFRATVTHDISVSPIDQSIWAKGLDIAKIGNKRKKVDYILGLSRQGEEIFRWSLDEHLNELSELLRPWGKLSSPFPSEKGDQYEGALNITHANAVQIIPPNKLEKSHPQFSAGNILVTEHHNGAAIIIDRKTRKIVWIHKGAHLGLHSPRWLENGHILMFVNEPLPNGESPAGFMGNRN